MALSCRFQVTTCSLVSFIHFLVQWLRLQPGDSHTISVTWDQVLIKYRRKSITGYNAWLL
jgi:hypothetical protein